MVLKNLPAKPALMQSAFQVSNQGMPPEINRMNQMKLIFYDGTQNKDARTIVVVQRVHVAGA